MFKVNLKSLFLSDGLFLINKHNKKVYSLFFKMCGGGFDLSAQFKKLANILKVFYFA